MIMKTKGQNCLSLNKQFRNNYIQTS